MQRRHFVYALFCFPFLLHGCSCGLDASVLHCSGSLKSCCCCMPPAMPFGSATIKVVEHFGFVVVNPSRSFPVNSVVMIHLFF